MEEEIGQKFYSSYFGNSCPPTKKSHSKAMGLFVWLGRIRKGRAERSEDEIVQWTIPRTAARRIHPWQIGMLSIVYKKYQKDFLY